MSGRARTVPSSSPWTGTLCLEWTVGGAGGASRWTLRWIIEVRGPGEIGARCEHEASGTVEPLVSRPARDASFVIDPVDGRAHLDGGEELRATLERDDHGSWRVVYAHTSLLARLGARGGEIGAPTCAARTTGEIAHAIAG